MTTSTDASLVRALRAAAVGLALFVVAGCASAAQPNSSTEWGEEQVKQLADDALAAGQLEQSAALEDGKVSFEEFDEAFDRLTSCAVDAGLAVSDPVLSPVSNNKYEYTMDMGTLQQSVAVAASDKCVEQHWIKVAQAYQFTTPSVMDVPLRDAVVECLRQEGVNPTGTEKNAAELAALPSASVELITDCTLNEANTLYPDLPSVSVDL